jgi:hypothetical protein
MTVLLSLVRALPLLRRTYMMVMTESRITIVYRPVYVNNNGGGIKKKNRPNNMVKKRSRNVIMADVFYFITPNRFIQQLFNTEILL